MYKSARKSRWGDFLPIKELPSPNAVDDVESNDLSDDEEDSDSEDTR